MTTDNAPDGGAGANVKRFIIFRADSEYNSSGKSSFTQASMIGNSVASGVSKRDYIEAESGRKDVFFIFLFGLVFLAYLGISGYGCFLAYEPMQHAGYFSYGVTETDVISLQTILAQIFTTSLLSGILALVTNAIFSFFPKAIYQVSILSAPIIYLALACSVGYFYRSHAAGIIFFGLFLIHAIYLISRKKHIRMYRYLILESVKVGTSDDRYFIPFLMWAFILMLTGFSITAAFGHFKTYLNKYEKDGALYAFFFSVVVFGWLWTVNLLRNQFKMVVAGLCLNELLREGALHENVDRLRSKLWKYTSSRFLGQALLSAFIMSLAELFVLMILFMRYENIHNLVSYMFLLVACQHIISFVFKQTGLIHNIMFGSSFFDGTFDVYIPFIFYDELCSHVISLVLLVIVGGACAIVGKMATMYISGYRASETAILLAMVSAYISLIINEIFFDYNRTSVSTHIISYGENPIVMSRTSPIFTEAVRVLRISEEPSIMETE
jgi:hypothetical protein